MDRRLPQQQILTVKEAEAVLAVPDLETWTRHPRSRDAGNAVLTGMRRVELMNLTCRHRPRARHGDDPPGQGQEGPHGPIGERALRGSRDTETTCARSSAAGADEGRCSSRTLGEAFSAGAVTQLVRDYV